MLLVLPRGRVASAAPVFFLGCGPMGNSEGNRDHTGRSFYFHCATIRRVAAAAAARGARAHVLDFAGLMDERAGVGGCR